MALVFDLYVGFGPAPSDEPQNYAGISKISEGNRKALRKILAESNLVGYTLLEGTGFYGEQKEPCGVVRVIEPDPERAPIVQSELEEVARIYKRAARQEEVWLTRTAQLLTIV